MKAGAWMGFIGLGVWSLAWLPGEARGQESAVMDELIQGEQASVDNEAVAVYGGSVGNLRAVFFLEWAGVGNPVDGHYYYLARGRFQHYLLKGTHPAEGVLELKEYTPSADGKLELSATCRLTKKVERGRVIWEGMMHNTDGRKLPMVFSRPQR